MKIQINKFLQVSLLKVSSHANPERVREVDLARAKAVLHTSGLTIR